jgi:hypothetical protein
MALGRKGIPAFVALVAGLGTFLTLAYGKSDVGDEFIYGLVVGAIAWWIARKAFSTNGTTG